MKPSLLYILPILFLVLISGCISPQSNSSFPSGRSPSTGGQQEPATQAETDPLYQAQSLGNLCSSLSGCFVLCKNNVGRCSQFCKSNPSHPWCKTLPKADYPEWIRDQTTQPLPEGSSRIRLILPAPLDKIDLTAIGGHGAHPGGHAEGLDHEWIFIKDTIPIGSWADGEVMYVNTVEDRIFDDTSSIVIYYGDGLWGEHMHVQRSLVKPGDKVKAGDSVAYGETFPSSPGYHSAEFNVADQHRTDGTIYWYKFVKGAMLVSPFDYLRDDVKQQLVEKWKKEILEKYASKGVATFGVVPTPWEPYLSNPILFHVKYPGELTGEWFLRSRSWADDRIPDILVFLPANTKYYQKQRVLGTEDQTQEQFLSGDWEADYQNKRFTITTTEKKYYGIFELDESHGQAVLKVEYQEGSYPAAFSTNARTYTERELISKGEELHYWQYPQDRI